MGDHSSDDTNHLIHFHDTEHMLDELNAYAAKLVADDEPEPDAATLAAAGALVARAVVRLPARPTRMAAFLAVLDVATPVVN